MSLQLRRAEHADRDLLFGWANDDAVRANAFHTEKIPYEKHVVWFDKMMADTSVHQYILWECDALDAAGDACGRSDTARRKDRRTGEVRKRCLRQGF